MSETVKVTGKQLLDMASKHIGREELKKLFKNSYFKDFAKIFHFMCLGSTSVPGESNTFGHRFVIKDHRNVEFEVIVDVVVKAHINKGH